MPSLQPKLLIHGDAARASLVLGVDAVADVVCSTLGPAGRWVLLDEGPYREPRSSRDGVTVAQRIQLSDPIANLGAQLVIAVSKKAASAAGDGTTTAMCLAQALFKGGVRQVAAGANPVLLKRGIDQAITAICGAKDDSSKYSGGILSSLTTPVTSPDQITQIGALSANSDLALGQLIAQALQQVGKDGTVTVEESQGTETSLEVVEGMQFPQGYLSPYFVTDADRMEAELRGDPTSSPLFLLLHEKPLRRASEIIPACAVAQQRGGSLLVVAEDIADEALAFLVINKIQGKFRSAAVKTPGFGDRRRALLDDLAVLTGATVISPELGLKPDQVTAAMLGQALRVTVTKDDTTVVGGQGEELLLSARRNDLREQIARTPSDFDRVRLEERLAKLTGGVAVVKVGGQTEAEMRERKDRAEDAMYATRAAVAEGIVPGGGTALLRAVGSSQFRDGMAAAASDGDVLAGWRLVTRACEEPLRRIVQNAGGEGGEVVAELQRRMDGERIGSNGLGYNAATSQFEDLLASGVIDPAKVTRTALIAAGSVAGLLLTNDAVIADDVVAAAEVRKSLTPVMPGGQQQMLSY